MKPLVLAAVFSSLASAQLFTLTKEQLISYTEKNPFERFADGRPKSPDALIERARSLSAEEIWAIQPIRNQYDGDFHVLHPGKKMVGRAFTVQFMPARPEIDKGLRNQFAIDMLQPGDVLVVDLFDKAEGGTIVGDNLFYYVMTATKSAGLVVDGSIRDLNGISENNMPA